MVFPFCTILRSFSRRLFNFVEHFADKFETFGPAQPRSIRLVHIESVFHKLSSLLLCIADCVSLVLELIFRVKDQEIYERQNGSSERSWGNLVSNLSQSSQSFASLIHLHGQQLVKKVISMFSLLLRSKTQQRTQVFAKRILNSSFWTCLYQMSKNAQNWLQNKFISA